MFGSLKLHLFFDSLRLFKFQILHGFRVVIANLSKKVDIRVQAFVLYTFQIVTYFIIRNPVP